MKVSNKMISIPPYISTSWRNVQAVHMTDGILVITLLDGEGVFIPDLTLQEIDLIFKAHTAYLELEERHETFDSEPQQQPKSSVSAGLGGLVNFMQSLLGPEGAQAQPIRIAFGNLENLGALMQHNQAQAGSPDLPPEVLEKVAEVAKLMQQDDPQNMPKAEPHCNCFHCQVARALARQPAIAPAHAPEPEPVVNEEDLRFQQWEIQQTGENIYTVTNKLNADERYSVHLGDPVGCTCGKPHCEHVVVVLQS